MKIRIKGNSVRLRLTKSEVEKLVVNKSIEESAGFIDNTLIYALNSRDDIKELTANFSDNKITVFIPEEFISNWEKNDIVSFSSIVETVNNEQLQILVEKDFKCIDETSEDQSDNFENPNLCN